MTTSFELTATNGFQPWNTHLTASTTRNRVAVSTETNHPSLGQDTAALSATSLLATPASAADDSRANRVAAIRQSIAAGTYFVSAHEVAGSILDSLF
jgi:flagellar biosynthesis anti-sigma factor FlgM